MRDDDRIKLEDCDRLTAHDIACIHRWRHGMFVGVGMHRAYEPESLQDVVVARDLALHRRERMFPPPPF